MPKRDRGDELGRSLVQLLRHGAHEANVPIDDEGWVALDAALAHVNRRGKSFTVTDVEQSVAACAKQRMALRTSPAGTARLRHEQRCVLFSPLLIFMLPYLVHTRVSPLLFNFL